MQEENGRCGARFFGEHRQMKVLKLIFLALLILVVLVFGVLVWQQMGGQNPLTAILATPTPAPPTLEAPAPSVSMSGEENQRLLELAYADCWRAEALGEAVSDGEEAVLPVRVTLLNADALAGAGARDAMLEKLQARVAEAERRSEIFEEDGSYREDVLRDCFDALLRERLEEKENFCSYWTPELRYRHDGEGWQLQNPEELYPFRPEAAALFAAVTEEQPLLPLRYPLPEDALWGHVPKEENFVETEDPYEIAALLEKPEARALIGEETLVWNPELPFVPGTLIRCYLDESILCILWQEPEKGCMGTFAETFVSDGSQLRRKISSDEPWSFWFERTSDFARDTNAVLAVGGDFYYHDRNCGVAVYQRQIIRFRPDNADTCFITADGDMLFLYRGDGISQAETEQFLKDKDVVFSLAFGPVLIDDGVDVTPEFYPWGETDMFYARSALGLLGRHHYLTMNINCDTTRPELDHLPNLRDAADAMVKRGCWKAYTLDGGQTATTAFHYQLINPVQFGQEKAISDIIYFASAVPEE